MCDFPSWIKQENGKALFLTDAEAKQFALHDAVGHGAIRKVYPRAEGVNCEGFPCHPDMAGAIRDGKCRWMMMANGYKSVAVNKQGELHRTDGPAIEYADGSKEWYLNGKRHLSI